VAFEEVAKLINEFKNKEYKCEDLENCLWNFVAELDSKLKQLCNHWCSVERYSDDIIIVAYGILETILVKFDYEVEYTIKIKNLSVEKCC
jgi:hypothetical protein